MKNVIGMSLVFALFLAMGQAWAEELAPMDATAVCARIQPTFFRGKEWPKKECFALIDKGYHFDSYAAAACNRYSGWGSAKATLKCMKEIAGKTFSRAAVRSCLYDFQGPTTKCLAAIGNHVIDDKLVPFCDAIFDGPEHTDCLRAVSDKHFSDETIKRCKSYTYADNAIACLRSAPSAPASASSSARADTPNFNDAVASLEAKTGKDGDTDRDAHASKSAGAETSERGDAADAPRGSRNAAI